MSRSRELLCVAMAVMWSQVTEVTASPQPMKNATFQMLPVSDVTFTQDVLWEKPAKSEVDCGRKCVGEARCSMFTFTPSTDGPGGSCRIHGKRQTPQEQQTSAPGARTYIITDFWIEKACTSSSDCTEPMAACYSGQCLCDGGFFFDYFQNACVSNCTHSLWNTYLEYTGMTLLGNDDFTNLFSAPANGDPATTCSPLCTARATCVTFSYVSRNDYCFFKSFTAQDNPDDWKPKSKYKLFQRTCM